MQEYLLALLGRIWQVIHICVIVLVWLAVFLGAFLGYFGLLGVAVALSLCITYLIVARREKQRSKSNKPW